MIYLYVGFFLCVIAGGLVWYVCNYAVVSILNTLQTAYPAYFAGAWVDFIRAMWHWMLLVAVLLPGLLWIYVNSQRKEAEAYF